MAGEPQGISREELHRDGTNREVAVESLARSIRHKLVEPAGKQIKDINERFDLLAANQRKAEESIKQLDSIMEIRIQRLETATQRSQKIIYWLSGTMVLSLAGVIYLLVQVL